jgi:hypothetical protein
MCGGANLPRHRTLLKKGASMNYGWRKLILFSFIVLLPALVVGISNFYVFPDSALSATIMLLVTVGVSGIFTYFSGDATARIRRYCIIADVVICLILCVNLGSHWLLAREVSASKQGVEERHVEENREEQRRAAEAQRQIDLAKAEADRAKAEADAAYQERRRLAQLPPDQRRERPAPRAPKQLAAAELGAVAAEVKASTSPSAPRLTPDQVRERWWWFLTALAFAEVFASVLGGAVLAGIWEWDRNRDGIADHLQQGRGSTILARPAGFVYAQKSQEQSDPKA